MKFTSPIEYNDYLVEKFIKIDINEYFDKYHTQFYPEQDISFMTYFLDLCKHKYEFYVPHTKLIEFGIMSENADSYE